MPFKYDVVIVGAGPAGVRCGEILAKAGRSVVIIEQLESVAVGNKVCAGGISLVPSEEHLHLYQDALERDFNQVIFVTPYQKKIIKSNRPVLITVDRHRLGQALLKQAQKAGVEFKFGSRAISLDSDRVICQTGEKLRFKSLVGADGSLSIIRQCLKIPSRFLGSAIQYRTSGIQPDLKFIFDTERFGPWYCWLFPYQNTFSIGFGGKIGTKFQARREVLDNFLTKIGFKPDSSWQFEGFTINSDFRGFRFNNIFLVGDASGITSPLTGEGIKTAWITGEEIAKTILDPKYQSPRLKKLIRLHWLHLQLVTFGLNHPHLLTAPCEISVFLLSNPILFKLLTPLLSA